MASEHIYDVVKTERVEGREKPFYSNVGKIIKTDKGYMKLHIPLLGWFDLYEPKPREDRPQRQSSSDEFRDSDIPF